MTEDDDGERRMRDVVRGPVPASRSRSPTPHLPTHTHFTNFQALQTAKRNASSSSDRQSDLADPLSISVQLGMPPTSPTSSGMPSRATSRRGSFSNFSDGIMSRTNSTSKAFPTTSSTAANAQIARLETELILLQSEVNFQIYLKQLHLAHMGTLHREKVLDSGAEAERQSLVCRVAPIFLMSNADSSCRSIERSVRSERNSSRRNWRWTSYGRNRASRKRIGFLTSTISRTSSNRCEIIDCRRRTRRLFCSRICMKRKDSLRSRRRSWRFKALSGFLASLCWASC